MPKYVRKNILMSALSSRIWKVCFYSSPVRLVIMSFAPRRPVPQPPAASLTCASRPRRARAFHIWDRPHIRTQIRGSMDSKYPPSVVPRLLIWGRFCEEREVVWSCVAAQDTAEQVADQWDRLCREFQRPATALIFHLTNHFALLFALRSWTPATGPVPPVPPVP